MEYLLFGGSQAAAEAAAGAEAVAPEVADLVALAEEVLVVVGPVAIGKNEQQT